MHSQGSRSEWERDEGNISVRFAQRFGWKNNLPCDCANHLLSWVRGRSRICSNPQCSTGYTPCSQPSSPPPVWAKFKSLKQVKIPFSSPSCSETPPRPPFLLLFPLLRGEEAPESAWWSRGWTQLGRGQQQCNDGRVVPPPCHCPHLQQSPAPWSRQERLSCSPAPGSAGRGMWGRAMSLRRKRKWERIFTCFRDFRKSLETPMVCSNPNVGCSSTTAPILDPPLS